MTSVATTPSPAPANTNGLRLSFSRVDTYTRCPLRFKFGYVDRLPQEPSPALSWGTSIHAAIEAWWNQKLPQAPSVDVLLGALYQGWEDLGFEGMERDQKVRYYRHAQEVLRRHHQRYAPTYRPAVATEEWFELDLGDDIQVVGSIDHVARTDRGGIGIVDWKTNKTAKPRKYVLGSLQLAIYALAARELWGQEPEWVALDFVVAGVRVTVPRSDIDTAAALAAIRDTAAKIRAEVYPAKPSRLCDWCDHRAVCPAFAGEGPDVLGRAVIELQSLQRQRARDDARIAQLSDIVARLGPDVGVELPT